MFEKVNPSHPDKIADRIAGAIVDMCYARNENPKVAVEVLIGHGICHIIMESSEELTIEDIEPVVMRIAGSHKIDLQCVKQDPILSQNQVGTIRCGDNGIFKGQLKTVEEDTLSRIARKIYEAYPTDGKYILDGDRLIICQSNASTEKLKKMYKIAEVNPLGYWTGGLNVDTGCTNRKLGSDMGRSVTGGGLHGKDLSKADVSVNIYAFLKAQEKEETVEYSCAIGDEYINGIPYSHMVNVARKYIESIGGFEKFAEWGLI